MTKLGPYEVHPAADLFPLIEGDEFDELVQDIKQNDLREPIVLTGDRKILIDGRNRYRACLAAGVDATYRTLPTRTTEIEILDLIVSLNVARRHLNPGQKAVVANGLEPMYATAIKATENERKLRAPSNQYSTNGNATSPDLEQSHSALQPPTTDSNKRKAAAQAAKSAGASRTSTANAKYVEKNAPDLYEEVRAGRLALDAAYRQAKQRVRDQPKPEPPPSPQATTVMLTLRTHDGAEVAYPQPKTRATFNETKGEGISWASWSWNPVTGCLHGCEYCYAREIATSERFRPGFPAGFTPLFHHERLDAPQNTAVPLARQHDPAWRRVFVCSMADLYGRWVPDEWISQVHASMLKSPQWQYILLTKFPARYVGLDLPPKAWVGTSVDEQKRVRIAENAFREIDGVAVKWLSLEPLREPLEFTDLSVFDWVVIGAQTETRQPDGTTPAFAPPFEWVARLVVQALDAGCKVHLKPNLRSQPGMEWLDQYPTTGDRTT